MTFTHLNQNSHAAIEALLLGRRIVAAEKGEVQLPGDGYEDEHFWWLGKTHAEGVLTLDDGTRIYVQGNEGGCACSAGDYPLAHLATVDNVITSVRLDNRPDGEDHPGDGWYRIYVVADSTEINVASFEGSDGNGFYGTGYELYVWHETAESNG